MSNPNSQLKGLEIQIRTRARQNLSNLPNNNHFKLSDIQINFRFVTQKCHLSPKKWQNQARLLKNLNILLPRIFKNQNIWKKFQFLKGKFSFSSDIGLPSGFLTSFHIISSFNETCILSGTHYHVKMSWSTLQMTGSPINHQFRMKMSDMKHSKAVVLFKLRWEMLMEHRMEYNKF